MGEKMILILIAGVLCVICCLITFGFTVKSCHIEAAAQGHAKYYVTDSGIVKWKWLEPCNRTKGVNDG